MRCVSLHGVLRMTLVALALLLPSLAATQETQQKVNGKAVVRGTVTDTTGAVVTAASVVLSNGVGAKKEIQTDDTGSYAFTDLDAGTYSLSVTAPNFALKVMDNITLTSGLDLSLDVALEPASAKSEVNVESGG